MRVISGNLKNTVKVEDTDTEYRVDMNLITVIGPLDNSKCPNCEQILVHGRLMIFPANGGVTSGIDAAAVWCPVCLDAFNIQIPVTKLT